MSAARPQGRSSLGLLMNHDKFDEKPLKSECWSPYKPFEEPRRSVQENTETTQGNSQRYKMTSWRVHRQLQMKMSLMPLVARKFQTNRLC